MKYQVSEQSGTEHFQSAPETGFQFSTPFFASWVVICEHCYAVHKACRLQVVLRIVLMTYIGRQHLIPDFQTRLAIYKISE